MPSTQWLFTEPATSASQASPRGSWGVYYDGPLSKKSEWQPGCTVAFSTLLPRVSSVQGHYISSQSNFDAAGVLTLPEFERIKQPPVQAWVRERTEIKATACSSHGVCPCQMRCLLLWMGIGLCCSRGWTAGNLIIASFSIVRVFWNITFRLMLPLLGALFKGNFWGKKKNHNIFLSFARSISYKAKQHLSHLCCFTSQASASSDRLRKLQLMQ